MGKVVIYIAMSLDGYIADKHGSVDWLGGDGSDEHNFGSYPEFMETIGAVVLGYTTYHQIITELSPGNWPYEGKQTYVLTHRTCIDKPGITFVDATVTDLLAGLKQAQEIEEGQEKDIWICGGATLVNQVLQARLADVVTINVMPTLLGDGIRLFDSSDSGQKLKLVATRDYNGIVDLVYQPLVTGIS